MAAPKERRGGQLPSMAINASPEPPAAATVVRYEIRRRHDGSPISRHCCTASARERFERLTLADLMGPTPPGPLEWAEADIIDTATGDSLACTGGLVPLHGRPPAEDYPYYF